MTDLPDIPKAHLPATVAKNRRTVEKGFWKKLLKVAGRVPFADDLGAAYFCAMDPQTPSRVRAILLAALAYFVIPTDVVPDFIAGFGFTDDAAVMAMALGLVSGQIKPRHRERARQALGLPPLPKED
jgi:uncharacterized membrane protein YkvA (DUF1232 family)